MSALNVSVMEGGVNVTQQGQSFFLVDQTCHSFILSSDCQEIGEKILQCLVLSRNQRYQIKAKLVFFSC